MKRLVVVVAVALGGFAAAFVAFGDAARANCVLDAQPDASYEVALEDPTVGDEHVLVVSRDGEPVVGAWVCARLAPASTPGAVAGARADELDDGRYALPLDLTTPGVWSGTVLVGEHGASEVSAPLTAELAVPRS